MAGSCDSTVVKNKSGKGSNYIRPCRTFIFYAKFLEKLWKLYMEKH